MRLIKRVFDLIIALPLLILLLPIIILLSIMILITMGRPIFFTQRRPGYKEQVFTIYKFRSMTEEKDSSGNLLPDEQRINWIGSLIRKLSLDELPQLWNVLKGELSLVGPRPLLIKYLPLYNSEQKIRHDVPPGITGWAQVNGRNAISWKEKFELDVWYVKNWSLLLDFKILFLTFLKVFRREGVNTESGGIMPPFDGNN